MSGFIKRMTDMGVLGINRRNAEYTLAYNTRDSYPLVDDKYLTKNLALKSGIAVPELYGIIEINRHIEKLPSLLSGHEDFVVKPAQGSGGDGILVVSSRSHKMYRMVNGMFMSQEELDYHISNILSGIYSLGSHPDKALIEYRVKVDPVFDDVTYLGVPDIRIIVFLGVPVMSMVRLPTRMSGGKSNLHQGAVGAGIDISKGVTLAGVWNNDIITEHPDTGNSVADFKIPGWQKLLELASQCYDLTGLGYQGVDIVLDKNKGPLILELNARPGLNIQIANKSGLLPRLKFVEKHHKRLNSIEDRTAFARNHFAAKNI